MTREALLPPNASPMQVGVSESVDRLPELMPEFDKLKHVNLYSNNAALQALIAGYGLSEVTQFIPGLLNILTLGIAWQRVKGTPKAVELALQWLDYVAELEQAPIFRRKWHATQLRFPELPANDRPDLIRIAGAVGLSMPARSYLRRGVFEYDAPAGESESTVLDGSMVEFDSGVVISGATPLWSFGRSVEFVHDFTEAEGLAVGNWIPVVVGGLLWEDADYPWTTATFPWASSGEIARRALMAEWFDGRQMYACLRDASNAVIGYRRVRAAHPVNIVGDGPYTVAGLDYEPQEAGQRVYIEAMTGFGDAADVTATQVSILVGGTLDPEIPVGQLWLEPGDITGGNEFATKTISIPLRETVRDQFKFVLRF